MDAPLPLLRLRLITENTSDSVAADAPRADAPRTSLVATHSPLGVRGGSFLSLLNPPDWAALAAKRCRNVHTLPILAGDPDGRNPKTLTDDEKREARATDPRAAASIDRVDTIPQDAFERPHGVIRPLRPRAG